MLTLPLNLTDRVLRPARVCTITRRDATVIRIAESQDPITVGSETWTPLAGVTLSAIKHVAGGEPSSMAVTGAATIGGTPFALEDIDNGKFDSAEVLVYMLNRSDLSSKGLLFSGTINGAVAFDPLSGAFSFDCRGIAILASQPFYQVFGPACRTDLGSVLCKIPLRPDEVARGTAYSDNGASPGDYVRVNTTAGLTPDKWADRYFECTTSGTTHATTQPSYSTTIGATTTDGSAVFTCRNAWTRAARIATIEDQFSFTIDRDPDARAVDGWFNGGAFVMYDGYSAFTVFEVGNWTQSTKKIICYLPIHGALNTSLFAVGDWLEIWRGCSKRRTEDCFGVFANAKNFRGEDTITGLTAQVVGA